MRDQILATVGQAEPNGYRLRRAIDGLSGRFARMQAGGTALFGLPTNSSLSPYHSKRDTPRCGDRSTRLFVDR